MSNLDFHYWLVLHPDITRPIGGVKQMHRLAESISSYGRKVTIIQQNDSFHPGWFESQVNTISHRDWISLRDTGKLSALDILIFPETYLSSIKSYSAGLPCIIFNQNASYTFGIPGSSNIVNPTTTLQLYQDECIKHVLCVSKYDYNFLAHYILRDPSRVSCITNGLDDYVIKPVTSKKKRIAFMPRKNSLDSIIVQSLLKSCKSLDDWTLIPIHNMPHSEVISLLRSSFLFLSFGHPEGFGLPVAEALASGCAVIGYSGLGGNELFDIGKEYGVVSDIPFGDWPAFVDAVLSFSASLSVDYNNVCKSLLSSSSAVQLKYNMNSMRSSIISALHAIETSF